MGEVKLLSVHGSFNAEFLSPDTKYKVEFVLRFRKGKHVSGWSKNPVRSVLIPPGKTWNEAIPNKVNLAEKGSQKSFVILAGEFFNPQFNSHGDIQFHLDENKEWKTGLVIKGMVGVVPDVIGCVFGDLTPLELRILDRIDLGQYFEFRVSNENSISYIASGTSSSS
ncbi:hypothetical protein H5410_005743 [Solanum commersonii]|uniref:Uncharacterized protein n=1 Tax=Solanum commersonii TaxID=4109 RepID=A0A9J6A7F9_SOLCO|nr:hypothetical protein H5410_005743 [Solanum commersonii]